MNNIKIGVIGGSGLYNISGMKNIQEMNILTPFGMPSDKIIIGELQGINIAFLPRHGKGHVLTPSEINYQANIYAMKSIGVESLVSVSAVGSLKEELTPGTLIIPDQFFDYTKNRKSTFFGDGIVAHVSFANPICPNLSEILYNSAKQLGIKTKNKATYICMEGPQFSSKAESNVYRQLGFDIIGMTNATEAKLAKEAEMCYSSLSFVTDYDCWHESEEEVSVKLVLKVLMQNVENGKNIIKNAVKNISEIKTCSCRKMLENAIITDKTKINDEIKKKLGIIISKYI